MNLSYDDLALLNMRNCPKDPPYPYTPQGDAAKFVERQTALLLCLSERVKRTKAFEILSRNEKTSGIKPSIIDKRSWKDLDLLCGSEEQPKSYLGSIINKAHTDLGKGYFLGLIARPTSDQAALSKRQKILKNIIGNEHLLAKEARAHLKKMGEDEDQLLSFWDEKLQLPGCILNQYFKYNKTINNFCNRSSFALELHSCTESIKKIVSAITQIASAILLPLYAISLTGYLGGLSKFLQTYTFAFIGTSGPLYSIAALIPNVYTRGIAALFAGGFANLSLRSKIAWTKADLAMDALIQKKMVAVASYYRKMKALHALFSKHPELIQNLEHFSKLDNFVKNKELKNLFNALESNTFNSEATFFFRRGNVLLAWNLMQDKNVQKLFEPALMAIAEIDTFTSTANFFNESQTDRVKFCFPEFIENTARPRLEMTDFHNVFVDKTKVVKNSIKIGADTETPNAILTGPPGAGKSTILKSVATAIILAQSIGIAPAESMKLSRFSLVASSMNISDDLKGGNSHFQQEADFIVELEKKRKDLSNNEFSFCALDELFTGTTREEGGALAYASLEKLGEYQNNLGMIVTHDDFSTQLEESTKNYKNYKLSTDQENKPTYMLEIGKSTQRIAFNVALQRGMDPSTVTRAKELMKQNV